MDLGESLTRWTARAAVLLYSLALALRITAAGRPRRLRPARLAWTAGLLVFLLHVGGAFHFFHGWSHADAYASTARQTEQATGLAWGGGLFANYAFALVWASDVAWWWARPLSYLARPRAAEWAVQGFLGFIVFNAAVVFADGQARWIGVGACVVLALLWITRRSG